MVAVGLELEQMEGRTDPEETMRSLTDPGRHEGSVQRTRKEEAGGLWNSNANHQSEADHDRWGGGWGVRPERRSALPHYTRSISGNPHDHPVREGLLLPHFTDSKPRHREHRLLLQVVALVPTRQGPKPVVGSPSPRLTQLSFRPLKYGST